MPKSSKFEIPLPEYVVKASVSVQIPANSKEQALEAAEEYLRKHVAVTSAEASFAALDWRPAVEELLGQGYSQNEAASTVGIDRASVSRAFPGRGMSQSEGGKIGQLIRKTNKQLRE